jgi:hypothetical protein
MVRAWPFSQSGPGGLRIAAALAAAPLLAGTGSVVAQTPAPMAPDHAYEIPAQSLTAALASYARVSGVDILYENALGSGRTSSAVNGRMSPQAALRILLAGTGLSARFTGPKAAIVYLTASPSSPTAEPGRVPGLRLDMAEVRAPVTIGTPDRSGYQRYAQAVLNDIRAILSEDPELRGQAFRLRLALTISAAGRIENVALLQVSGDRSRDAHIRHVLTGHAVAPPPNGLAEALRFEVIADRLGGRG